MHKILLTKHFFVVLIIFIFLFLGYFPFDWETPSNFKLSINKKLVEYEAKRTYQNPNLYFSNSAFTITKPGIAYLPIQSSLMQEVKSDSYLILELSIQANHLQQIDRAAIFTISHDPKQRNITVAQKGSDLILRLRTIDTSLNGLPPYVIENIFTNTKKIKILIKIINRKLEVLINGVSKLESKLPRGALSNWDTSNTLVLGNELTFKQPWIGVIYKAAISTNTRSIDFIKNNTLLIPPEFTYIDKGKLIRLSIFDHPAKLSSRIFDYVINFFGFFVLGILLRFLINKNVSNISLVSVCVFLSLSIEIGQLFLDSRKTSIYDFVLNSAGGIVGILFISWVILRPFKVYDNPLN